MTDLKNGLLGKDFTETPKRMGKPTLQSYFHPLPHNLFKELLLKLSIPDWRTWSIFSELKQRLAKRELIMIGLR